MKIIIASDHVGFSLKQRIVEHFRLLDVDYLDAGPTEADKPVDYPDYAQMVARAVRYSEYDRGILVCGTGQGMAIAANRLPGIRAALCYNLPTANQSRTNNNANVLCLGNDELTPDEALKIVDAWLTAEFQGGVHASRLAKVDLDLSSMQRESLTRIQGNSAASFKVSFAISPKITSFSPLLFAGRLNDGLRFAAESGFDAVEVSLCSASEIQPKILATALADYGLSLSAIATGRMCLEDGLCLSNPSASVRSQVKERLLSLIELAAVSKAAVIIGGVRGRLSGGEAEKAEQRASAVVSIRQCAILAHDLGIHLLLEPINRYETNFINSAEEAIKFIEEIGHPAVRLLLDTFHMNIEEIDPCATVRKTGSRLGYMHVADNNRLAPGQGHIDFPALIQALSEIGYHGYLSAEILPSPDDATALSQTAHYLHPIMSNKKVHPTNERS